MNLNGNLIDGLGDPKYLDSATNKKCVDTENIRQDIAIADKADKSYVDVEIAKVHVDSTPLLPRDGSRSMTGDLNMDENHILSVKNLNDYKVDDAYEVRVRDLGSVVNKEYLNEKFLKVDKDGNYFDLKQNTIKNCEPYYDGLFDNNSLVSKAFVDAEISKLPKPATDVLKLDGSKAMTGNLNMGNNDIDNLKTVVEDDGANPNYDKIKYKAINFELLKSTREYLVRTIADTEADLLPKDGSDAMTGDLNMTNHSIINLKDAKPSVNFVMTSINHSNTIMDGIIDSKKKESERLSIESNDIENVFKKVMDDDLFKEDDDDIHKVGVQNKNFHSVNKKTYEFKIDYDSSIGYYSNRLSIDLIYLPIGSYTMVYEMYVDDGITIDEIDALSGTLSVEKMNSKINGTNTRSIIHFTKHTIHHGFDDLDIDIKLKSKTDPQTTIHVVVYGVKGYVNNVSVNLWDRFYYYNNNYLNYEVLIDMKGKNITGLGIGVRDDDAVNKLQVDAHILHVVTHRSYFYFTTDLNHNETDTVKFPTNINKYPFSTVSNNNESHKLILSLDGYYKITYTDFYKLSSFPQSNDGLFKILNSERSNNELFSVSLKKETDWKHFTINAVVKIEKKNPSVSQNISLLDKSY